MNEAENLPQRPDAIPAEQRNTVEENAMQSAEMKAVQMRHKKIGIQLVLLLGMAVFGWFLYSRTYETTDDAQVDGHLDQVAARISGTIVKVYANDNQLVEAGQPLVDLDTHDQEVALAQARAQYDQALAQLKAQRPSVLITSAENHASSLTSDAQVAESRASFAAAAQDLSSAAAHVADAEAVRARDASQLQRDEQLFSKNEISRQDYERAVAAARSAEANLEAMRAAQSSMQKTLEQRRAEVDAQVAKRDQIVRTNPQQLEIRNAQVATAEANVEAAAAQLKKAELELGYCHIVAPARGIVTERAAEVGNRVSEGAPLMMIVERSELWITANFKETQLRHMRVGQSVTVHVDALGRDLSGTVEGMPAVTGARSSVLPPENATGNYIKVVQRMPVRIRVHAEVNEIEQLRPGMSVEARVWLR